MNDETVEQARKAREDQAAQLNSDLKAVLADARRRQKDSGRQFVSYDSKPTNAG